MFQKHGKANKKILQFYEENLPGSNNRDTRGRRLPGLRKLKNENVLYLPHNCSVSTLHTNVYSRAHVPKIVSNIRKLTNAIQLRKKLVARTEKKNVTYST